MFTGCHPRVGLQARRDNMTEFYEILRAFCAFKGFIHNTLRRQTLLDSSCTPIDRRKLLAIILW